MKKLETVLAQLSDLYEFNKKLKLYELQKQEGESISSESDAPAHALRRDVADE
jgi:hypothetical protein